MARPVYVAVLALAAVLPAAADDRPAQAACNRANLPGRGYIECLERTLRITDQAVEAAHARAVAAVEARADLAPTQRTRWKNLLEESQSLFVRFRNFECQNVAPYEGETGRIGAFEQRLACLIDKNAGRARDLETRYGK